MKLDYFYGSQAEQFTFYRIPKALFTDPQFRGIATEAKVLYGLLLDRMSLSVKNNWTDEQRRVYIIFRIEEIMDALGCAEQKAAKLLNELEKGVGLIERKRQGLGRPNLIYVKNFADSAAAAIPNGKSQILNYENRSSGASVIADQELPESQTNNTKINDTNLSDTDINPIPSSLVRRLRQRDSMQCDPIEERNRLRKYLEEQLEIDHLKERHPNDTQELDEIFEILLDTLCSTKKTIRISGEGMPTEVVRSVLMKVDSSHIEYVLDCFNKNTTEVRNIRAYILAALYNAPFTISNYYTSQVHHDMPYLAKYSQTVSRDQPRFSIGGDNNDKRR